MKNGKGSMIGVSLIFVVFVLLCLVTFGTLSLMLSIQDNELSLSVTENVEQFYEADMLAQEQLQSIDTKLHELYDSYDSIETYAEGLSLVLEEDIILTLEDDMIFLEFTTTVSENEALYSKLAVVYTADGVSYSINTWALQHIES